MKHDQQLTRTLQVKVIPYEYESLESYLLRAGLSNHYQSLDWIKNFIRTQEVRSYGFNYAHKKEILNVLSMLLDLDIETIEKMTVYYYGRELWLTRQRDYEPTTIYLRSSRFCYQCVYEKPYQRIYWFIDPIYICPIHHTLLNESCSSCGATPTAYDLLFGICKCGSALGSEEPCVRVLTDFEYINQDHMKIVFSVYNESKQDFGENMHYRYLNNEQYFKFINSMYKLFKRNTSFMEIIPKYNERYFTDILKVSENRMYLKQDAHIYYTIAEGILIKWPNSMVKILKLANENTLINGIPTISRYSLSKTFNIYQEFYYLLGCYSYLDILRVFSKKPAIKMIINPLKTYFKRKYTVGYFRHVGRYIGYGTNVDTVITHNHEWQNLILGDSASCFVNALHQAGYLKLIRSEDKEYYTIDNLVECLYDLIFSLMLTEILFDYPQNGWINIEEASKLVDPLVLFKSMKDYKVKTGLCIYYEGIYAICFRNEEIYHISNTQT